MPEGVNETWLRIGVFAAVFAVLAGVELLRPRRALSADKGRRWLTNLSIVAIDSLVVRVMGALAVPVTAVAAAMFASTHGLGLLNRIDLPAWVEILVALIALDLAIWLQHVASHKIPLLWRLHQMHHADVDIDVSTAIRFHPVEIALSILWKIVCVVLLGAAPAAVVLFEIILNAGAMFSHANIALPRAVDRALRRLVVTPDMHRVHHSVIGREHDSNYGFNLAVWDRMFGTYTPDPEGGQTGMTIGLDAYQSAAPTRLWWSLMLPFDPRGNAETRPSGGGPVEGA